VLSIGYLQQWGPCVSVPDEPYIYTLYSLRKEDCRDEARGKDVLSGVQQHIVGSGVIEDLRSDDRYFVHNGGFGRAHAVCTCIMHHAVMMEWRHFPRHGQWNYKVDVL
jgi:hypothetical protein